MSHHLSKRVSAVLALALAIGVAVPNPASAFESTHTFKIDDIIGGFDGRTYGIEGNGSDPDILCGLEGSETCPVDGPQPFTDKEGTTLYPIDSEFGFYVVDYAKAITKVADGVYTEGFAGNIVVDGEVVGLTVSNAATDTFRVPAPLGTWCAGLGNTSVKCSTEHYTTMEHIKTCHETVPYVAGDPTHADPFTGAQPVLYDPVTGEALVDCADTKLDNTLLVIGGVFDESGATITDAGTAIESAQIIYDGIQGYLLPNEATVLENLAAGSDYSVTAKDDGKPLYRWGDLIKKPNDIRLYAPMGLPEVWTTDAATSANGGLGLRVLSAVLRVEHLVTNNPNDQLRPEDMENEGAAGRRPGYADYTATGPGLVSDTDCYEGDGDFIPAVATVLRNDIYPYGGLDPEAGDPYVWSTDLADGLSNGWYTTVDREPFEWAYDSNGDGGADYGSPVPLETSDALLSGPRWRLTAQKFGQDVPGLEIPLIECSPPPYQNDNIKYEVGAPVVTVINLLDWSPTDARSVIDPATGKAVSPLAFSNGWVSDAANEGAIVNPEVPVLNSSLDAVSINGAPLSRSFDLQVYVKGDKKATSLYRATLVVRYEGEDEVVGEDVDVAATALSVPAQITAQNPKGRIRPVSFTVQNVGDRTTPVSVSVCGTAAELSYEECLTGTLEALPPYASYTFEWKWAAPEGPEMVVLWEGTSVAAGDVNPDNNTLTGQTLVRPIR